MTRAVKEAMLDQWFEFTSRNPPDGWKYGSPSAFVAAEGVRLSSEPFTTDEERALLSLFYTYGKSPRTRACYETAYQLTMLADIYGDEGFSYGEGLAVGSVGIPIEHAVVVFNDKPVDISWRDGKAGTKNPAKLLARAKTNLANNVYNVVVFPLEYVSKAQLKRGHYGIIYMNRELAEFGSAAYKEEVAING